MSAAGEATPDHPIATGELAVLPRYSFDALDDGLACGGCGAVIPISKRQCPRCHQDVTPYRVTRGQN